MFGVNAGSRLTKVKTDPAGNGKARGKGDRIPGTTVFFGGVPFETSEGFLRAQFERVGQIVDFDLWKRFDGLSKGYGTCQFVDAMTAQAAIQNLNGQMIDGRMLLVKADGEPDAPFDRGTTPSKSFGGGAVGKGKGKAKGKADRNPAATVFFGGVPFETREGFLRGKFEQVGEVVDFDFWRRHDGSSKGMGTCEFSDAATAQVAIQSLNGQMIDGRMLLVKADGEEDAPFERPATSQKGKGGKADRNTANTVFFGGVPFETSEGFLRSKFELVGVVVDFDLWRKPDGSSKGYGTCEYVDAVSAQAAIQSLNGQMIDGRMLLVKADGEPDGPMGSGGRARSEPYSKGFGGKGKGKGNAACRIFWSGVPATTTEGYLRSQFERVGHVIDFDFWKNAEGTSLGNGTVEFDHYLGARRAVEQIDGAVIDGNQIAVKMDTGGAKGKGGKAYGKAPGKAYGKQR